jgi:hypothetical protein
MLPGRFARALRPQEGIRQRELSRVACEWGRDLRVHAVAFLVFGRNYKVQGVLGYSLGLEPLWYGEPPAFVARNGLRFKAPFQEGGPIPVSGTEPETFEGTFLCDSWGIVEEGMRAAFRGERPLPVNVHGQGFLGRTIVDVVFEPTLHCVRAVVLRRGTFRQETCSVLAIPALAENLRPAAPQRTHQLHWPWVPRD